MNRILFIISFIIYLSFPAMAQVDTTIIMPDLVISGNRISTLFSEASRDIQIITRAEIKKKPVQSIAGLLSYSPGVDIRQRGPMGVQSDIGIRGGTFEQTLILLNGIKLTDPQTGHHIMNIPVPLDHIEQIEVLKGPAARVYGQNAFSGAVNFITKVPESRIIGLRAYGGSFGSYGGNISLSLPLGKYRQYISYSRDASDGYRHNTDYSIDNIFYQSEIPAKNGKYELIFGFTDRRFGANGFYASPDYSEQYEEVSSSITSVSYERRKKKLVIKPRLYWRWNKDRYLFIRQNPEAYQNLHETNTLGAEINSSFSSRLGITGFGIEYRKEKIGGDWLRGGNESKSNLDGFGRENFGVFTDHRFVFGSKFDVTPGLYVNWYSDFKWDVFPGIDLGYNLSNEIRVFGNVGRSYRIPTFYDQYYSSPVEEGNPDLKPEQALTYELGVRVMKRGFSFEGNYFIRDASQLIDWVYNPVDSIWKSQNFQDITSKGVEIVFKFAFSELIGQEFPIYQMSLSYNYLDQNLKKLEDIQSRYALEHVRNQVIFGLDHRIVGKLKNSFNMRYIDRVEQEPYVLIDDRIYYEHNDDLSIFLEATNLTDQNYTEVMTIMPGRAIRLGLKLNIAY